MPDIGKTHAWYTFVIVYRKYCVKNITKVQPNSLLMISDISHKMICNCLKYSKSDFICFTSWTRILVFALIFIAHLSAYRTEDRSMWPNSWMWKSTWKYEVKENTLMTNMQPITIMLLHEGDLLRNEYVNGNRCRKQVMNNCRLNWRRNAFVSNLNFGLANCSIWFAFVIKFSYWDDSKIDWNTAAKTVVNMSVNKIPTDRTIILL